MATNVRVARTTRAKLRLSTTAIGTVAEGGTVVDLDDAAIKRDLNRSQGRWVILTDVADSGIPVGAAGGGVADAGESTIAVAAEAGNAIAVTITLKDVTGAAVSGVRTVNCWLSSSATTGAVATDDSITVTATTGNLGLEVVDDLVIKGLTNSSGVLVLSVAHAGDASAKYLWVEFPNGETKVSSVIDLA